MESFIEAWVFDTRHEGVGPQLAAAGRLDLLAQQSGGEELSFHAERHRKRLKHPRRTLRPFQRLRRSHFVERYGATLQSVSFLRRALQEHHSDLQAQGRAAARAGPLRPRAPRKV